VIAAWIAYALATGALVATLCWLLERLAQSARLPTRGIWIAGMGTMLVVGALAPVSRHVAPRLVPTGAATRAPAQRQVVGAATRTTTSVAEPASAPMPIASWRDTLDARVAWLALSFARWDRTLLMAWALLTAFLAGVLTHAAFEGRRLRHGLPVREVGGTACLITDVVGPCAVGARAPAILLPRWALDLDEALLGLVVRHEREHVASRDPLLLLVMLVAVVLVPWHLPLWWSWRRLRLAVEVDCDARVLRAFPDVRRYAQLLLLTGQRAPATPWASQPVVTVVAPLRPHVSQLGRRIAAMTAPRTSRSPLRTTLLAVGSLATAALALALPLPRTVGAQAVVTTSSTRIIDTVRVAKSAAGRVVVRMTEAGFTGFDSTPPTILVYGSGPIRVSVEGTDFRTLAAGDTLRLDRLPVMAFDVTDGYAHIQLVTPGRISIKAKVVGATGATGLSATDRHIIIDKGGNGVGGPVRQ
jgi:BlaR1 peptidase M56